MIIKLVTVLMINKRKIIRIFMEADSNTAMYKMFRNGSIPAQEHTSVTMNGGLPDYFTSFLYVSKVSTFRINWSGM